jgi:hypothetical protein
VLTRRLAAGSLGFAVVVACQGRGGDLAAPSPSLSEAGARALPAPTTLASVRAEAPVDAGVPPETLFQPWYLWFEQQRPRQKKNPRLLEVSAREAKVLERISGNPWRCLVTPVRAEATPSENAVEPPGWTVTRLIRCSSDGWRSWVESAHSVVATGEASALPPAVSGMNLRHSSEGVVTETQVVLRTRQMQGGITTRYRDGKALP